MASFSSALLLVSMVMTFLLTVSSGNFIEDQNVQFTFGGGNGKMIDNGQSLSLSLDNTTGSGFQSTAAYLFGRFDMQIKLVPGNSAGTVATFFLSSQGPAHDEIDFEFLGNSSGCPYTVHTNIYAQGKGNKEQQFRLWFDPTADFHNYTIIWNSQRIIFLVDNVPIRVFNNNEAIGVPFPNSQPMRVLCSLWDAEDWATEGGRVKTNWTLAPFTAFYRNFNANGCIQSPGSSGSASCSSLGNQAWQTQGLDARDRRRLKWVQRKCMIYNYCTDDKRFYPRLPVECRRSRSL